MRLKDRRTCSNNENTVQNKQYSFRTEADLQYEICATFLKSTGEFFSKNEFRIMTETNQLLDELKQSKKLFRDGDPD